MEILQQGAEARIYSTSFCSAPAITKQRFRKTYRHATLDARLTRTRLTQEARSLRKARLAGVATPYVYFVDLENMCITMELVPGATAKQWLLQSAAARSHAQRSQLYDALGTAIANMHNVDLIHGDLTTSNVLVRDGEQVAICMIDFGLAYTSTLHEDKAVDLYVLERAIKSTHPQQEPEMMDELLVAYTRVCKQSKAVMAKLEDVRMRGRKRSMIG
ncbi:serine/threonine-protein kinase bud32 [Sorochytrium milnesiophthora]